MAVKTRFAPSPTGFLHVGGARTALFSWLYAQHCKGEFVLRIEDTDRERSTQEAIDAIIESMKWIDLKWDEGPYYQTKRFDRYREVIDQLLAEGKAYKCYCSKERLEQMREEQMKNGVKPRYDGHCRDDHSEHAPDEPYVIRFRNPDDGVVAFDDMVKGHIEVKNSELDDLIIQRSDGTPTYNFCVVVDDWDMGITHVIRGDDHVNNTPRQINLYKALGAPVPVFCHLAMILGDDGAKLSKRHGAVSVMQYREDGYLPEALVNYLVRLGWSHGDQEIFTREEMINLFTLDAITKSASGFNTKKLEWLNAHYMKTLPASDVAKELVWHLDRLGIKVTEYDPAGVKKWMKDGSVDVLKASLEALKALPSWDAKSIDEALENVAKTMEIGMGKVGQPLRIAMTGAAMSPGIGDTMMLVGQERTFKRIEQAIAHFSA